MSGRFSCLVWLLAAASCAPSVAWRRVRVEPAVDLVSVWCGSGDHVYAIDSNGGVQTLRGSGPRLRWDSGGPIAAHGARMLQVAAGALRASTDGGESWTAVPTSQPFDDSYGRGSILGVASGAPDGPLFALGRYVAVSNSLESDYAYLLRSDDGGATWSRVWTGPDRGPVGVGRRDGIDVGSALGVLPSHAVVLAGEDGSVLVSSDGGGTFTSQPTSATAPLADLWASPSGVLYGVGRRGEVVVSTDGARTFRAVPTRAGADLTRVTGCGDEVWIVGERGTALMSTRADP